MYLQTHPNGNTPYRNDSNINKASMRKRRYIVEQRNICPFICENLLQVYV